MQAQRTARAIAAATVVATLTLTACGPRPVDVYPDYPVIVDDAEFASDIDPAQTFINLGNEYYRSGRYSQAIDEYRRAIEVNPYSDEAHASMGMAYYRLGRRDDAERSFRRALRLNGTNVLARNGVAMVSEDRNERAAQLEAAITYSPDMPELRNNLCYFLAESENYERAVEECRESIRLDSTNHFAHYNLGYAYQRQGLLDRALTHYEIAISLNPGWARVLNNMGLVHYYKSDFARAIESYEAAIAAEGTEAVYHYNLGLAYEALAHRLRAAELDGQPVPEMYARAGTTDWRLLYRRAADEMRTYLDKNPNAGDSNRVRAKINELRRRAS